MCFNSALTGLAIIVFGNRLHHILKNCKEYGVYINVYVNVFHALNMIMYFGRSKCEASAGHGVVLYQSGCSKGFQQRCCFQNRSGGQ